MGREKEIVCAPNAVVGPVILQNLHDPGGKNYSCHFTDEKTEDQTCERKEFILLRNFDPG